MNCFLAFFLMIGLAQASPITSGSKDKSEGPLIIDAADNFTILNTDNTLTAYGNVVATRGEIVLHCDKLTAYYKPAEGETPGSLSKIVAEGHVVIISEENKGFGDLATYYTAEEHIVLTGKNLKITGPNYDLTAKKSLEYYRLNNLAIATDDARFKKENQIVKADTLRAIFQENPEGKLILHDIVATEDLVILTQDQIITSKHGKYLAEEDTAYLYGDVKMTQGVNQLLGQYGEYSRKTGQGKVFPHNPENPKIDENQTSNRVEIRLIPNESKKKTSENHQ